MFFLGVYVWGHWFPDEEGFGVLYKLLVSKKVKFPNPLNYYKNAVL